MNKLIDFSNLEGFDWDHGNKEKNKMKHDVSAQESEEVFLNKPLIILPDAKHSQYEERLVALGKTNIGRYIALVFTIRYQKIRVITARDQNRKEKKYYQTFELL
jgi:uncharacterized protein